MEEDCCHRGNLINTSDRVWRGRREAVFLLGEPLRSERCHRFLVTQKRTLLFAVIPNITGEFPVASDLFPYDEIFS
jgi:hypothetical protein